jgi:hypothetical protein
MKRSVNIVMYLLHIHLGRDTAGSLGVLVSSRSVQAGTDEFI